MSVLKTVVLSFVAVIGLIIAAWAGAPRYVIGPVQIVSPSGVPLDADPSTLNPPKGEGDAPSE